MKVGYLNACMKADLEEEILPWSAENGFQAMEIGGMHAAFFRKEFKEDIEDIFDSTEIEITALGIYMNFLEGNENARRAKFTELKAKIDAAEALGISIVSTHVGCNNSLNYRDNVKLFKKEWIPVINYAKEKGVKIAIENCPMQSEFALTVGNLMFTPRIMGDLFSITPSNFGLNFDPSHLIWQHVNIPLVVEEFGERIFHTHAKDTKVNQDTERFEGTFGRGIYTFRIPGKGDLDWGSYIDALKDVGYKGVLSIELEDPDYEKDLESVKTGLLESKSFLEQFI
ncbi:MAG: TIM barrel protein [Candidatus Lokiarchaeota archaeon]|nr:TIM barrel protein [Candidatus Lokiarchaeota archaeon]